jgi:hypothetical protein
MYVHFINVSYINPTIKYRRHQQCSLDHLASVTWILLYEDSSGPNLIHSQQNMVPLPLARGRESMGAVKEDNAKREDTYMPGIFPLVLCYE